MLPHESTNVLLVHVVVLVLLPLESRSEQHLVSPCTSADVLLDLLIIVAESWNLTSLPGEVTNVETVLDRHEEEEAVHNNRPLVNVPPHCGV